MRPTWSEYALSLARAAATRSEDPWHQVGAAVLRHDRTVASVGYNGAPPGVTIDWSDKDARRPLVIHAEANALRYVHPGEAELLAVTLHPCAECVKLAAAYGISHVVYGGLSSSWDLDLARYIAASAGVELERLERLT